MEIPFSISGRDHDRLGARRGRCESYNIRTREVRNNEAWPSQADGQARRVSSARGAIAGVLLGASFWGAILVVVGLIKL
jgi:hypothetical protein